MRGPWRPGLGAAWVVARVGLARLMGRATGSLLVLVAPLALAVLLAPGHGAGSVPRLGVVLAERSVEAEALYRSLPHGHPGLHLVRVPGEAELRDALETGWLEMGLLVPAGYEAALLSGSQAEVHLISQDISLAAVLREVVAAALLDRSVASRVAGLLVSREGLAPREALDLARSRREEMGLRSVETISVGDAPLGDAPLGEASDPFALSARSALVLVAFLVTMLGAGHVAEDLGSGVMRRAVAAGLPLTAVIGGEAAWLFLAALLACATLLLGSVALLGVSWGDPLAVGLLVAAYALACSGAGLLAGARRARLGPRVALALGASLVGGAVVPLELLEGMLRQAAHVTPQAWVVEGLGSAITQGGDSRVVMGHVAALLTMAALLLAAGAWQIRARLLAVDRPRPA